MTTYSFKYLVHHNYKFSPTYVGSSATTFRWIRVDDRLFCQEPRAFDILKRRYIVQLHRARKRCCVSVNYFLSPTMLKSSEATLLPPSSSLRFHLENQINRNACNDAEDYGKRLSLIALLEMILSTGTCQVSLHISKCKCHHWYYVHTASWLVCYRYRRFLLITSSTACYSDFSFLVQLRSVFSCSVSPSHNVFFTAEHIMIPIDLPTLTYHAYSAYQVANPLIAFVQLHSNITS